MPAHQRERDESWTAQVEALNSLSSEWLPACHRQTVCAQSRSGRGPKASHLL